jgi:hypothetical protein
VFWNIALDVLMVSLLAVCIATTVILNRRLTGLRGDSAELEKLARVFQEATDRADHGVSGLKLSAQSLQERIDQARTLADDLQFLLERGGSLADRLEDGVRAAKRADVRPKLAQASGGAEPTRPRPAKNGGQPRSAAELHLLAAMRAHG